MDQVRPDDVLFLINAVYFKASWADKFEAKQTRDGEFETPDGPVPCKMMHKLDPAAQVARSKLGEMLALPYGASGRFRALVLLPKDTLEATMAALTYADIHAMVGGLRQQKTAISLPRFKAESGTRDISGELQALGIKAAFCDPAGFKGITETGISISQVLHQAVLEVNEEGTEAAAATAGWSCTGLTPVLHWSALAFHVGT